MEHSGEQGVRRVMTVCGAHMVAWGKKGRAHMVAWGKKGDYTVWST